jgi:hypothetical protein
MTDHEIGGRTRVCCKHEGMGGELTMLFSNIEGSTGSPARSRTNGRASDRAHGRLMRGAIDAAGAHVERLRRRAIGKEGPPPSSAPPPQPAIASASSASSEGPASRSSYIQ